MTVERRFRYTTALWNAFSGGGISSLQSFDNLGTVKRLGNNFHLAKPITGWVNGSGANVFVANHDTERVRNAVKQAVLSSKADSPAQNGYSLNNNSPNNTYVSALIFSLAHPYGKPTILSSYHGFNNSDAGAPNGGIGTCSRSGGENGWICQHRWTAVAGMVGFRNHVGDAPLTGWVAPQSQQIAFGRGRSY